jgi:hypothetical protein
MVYVLEANCKVAPRKISRLKRLMNARKSTVQCIINIL